MELLEIILLVAGINHYPLLKQIEGKHSILASFAYIDKENMLIQ